jgi:hypothetical protein
MNINFNTPSVEAQYIALTAHWDDRFYVNECLCGYELFGRTKSDLIKAFEFHIQTCDTKSLMKK